MKLTAPPGAPETLSWLLKCKFINQEKEGNRQRNREGGSCGMEDGQQEVCGKLRAVP